jgi:Mce-associated membrane protein
MADDDAAPEGELSESTDEKSTASPDGTSESPLEADTTEGDDAPRDEALRSRVNTEETTTEDSTETADADSADAEADADPDSGPKAKPKMSHVRLATIVGLVVVLALAGLVGWLGLHAYQSQKAEQQRELFLQVGRQGAVNLTTIDFEHADADVQRILDSATDTFYDDFSKRSQPFVDVVKQAQSRSVGTVTSAGIEAPEGASPDPDPDPDQAQVLVAVTVKTSNAGAAEQEPRAWRMRLTVKKVGDEAKVSNVEFVP